MCSNMFTNINKKYFTSPLDFIFFVYQQIFSWHLLLRRTLHLYITGHRQHQ